MPTRHPRELVSPASEALADKLTPRASDTLLVLIQNYAIAYERGYAHVAEPIERAIALRLDRIENVGTFAEMSARAHSTLLDCVLGDISRPVPTSPNPDPRP